MDQGATPARSTVGEGSLLERLADHVEKLLLHFRPAELDRLVVLYSELLVSTSLQAGCVSSSGFRQPRRAARRDVTCSRSILPTGHSSSWSMQPRRLVAVEMRWRPSCQMGMITGNLGW